MVHYWFLAALAGLGNPIPSPAELEEEILRPRRQIVRGEVVMNTTEVFEAEPGDPPLRPNRHHVWWDGQRARHDREYLDDRSRPIRTIECRHCPKEGVGITHLIEPSTPEKVFAMSVFRLRQNGGGPRPLRVITRMSGHSGFCPNRPPTRPSGA